MITTAPLPLGWQPTAYAGAFLLLRACLDLRLPALVTQTKWPPVDTIAPFSALLLGLGQRLAAIGDDEPDVGLAWLAGLETLPADWTANWQSPSASDDAQFQAALLHGLVGLRLLQPERLFVYELPCNGRSALIGADGSGRLYPFGRLSDEPERRDEFLANWLFHWQEATGQTPAMITASAATSTQDLSAMYDQGKLALQVGLRALGNGRFPLHQADLTLSLLAMALLRLWGRWLRQFAASTPAYLLQQFIHRSGAVHLDDDKTLTVALAPRPLDMILDMAGYLAPLEQFPWLPYRRIIFRSGVPL